MVGDTVRKPRKQETLRERGTVSLGLGLWAFLQNKDIFNQGHMAPYQGLRVFMFIHWCGEVKKQGLGGQ